MSHDVMIGQMPAVTRLGTSPWAAVVLLHEGFGLTDHIVEVAGRLASAGVATVVPALFWRTGTLQVPYSDVGAATVLAKGVIVAELVSDIATAARWLREATGLAAVSGLGFCFGASAACVAAVTSVVDSGVGWYPVRVPDYLENLGDDPDKAFPQVPFLLHIGDRDEFLDDRVLNWIVAAAGSPNVEVMRYDAGHGFFNDLRPDLYDATAATESWQATLTFLRRWRRVDT